MTETQTHQALIGDDGELTAPAPEQNSEESVYAALPQLFLLDPSHAAYIAGKKTKPAAQTRRESLFSQFLSEILKAWAGFLGFIFLLMLVCSFVYFRPNAALGHAVEVTLGIAILGSTMLGCMIGLPWLLALPSKWKEKRAKRRLYMHGVLLKGEITYFKTMYYKKRALPSRMGIPDEIHYRFTTPKGRELNTKQSIPYRGKSMPIQIGKPVAVLYLNDKNYMLL
jgi:hypothetical protein